MRLRHRVRWADHFTRLVTAASLLLTTTGFTPAPDGGRPPTERRAPEAAPAASTARVYLPYLVSAGSEVAPALADLIPPGVAVVVAEADALGEHATVTAAGAAVLFREQRLAVIAPAGAYPETIALTLRTAPAAATAASAALTFALEARTLAGAAVAHAAQPVRLVVDLRGWPPPAGQAWYLGYQDPQEPALWHRPEVTVHDAAGLISVQTNHFSTWAAGAEPEPWQVSPSLPTAAAFSGAAAYHYPIPAPASPARFPPDGAGQQPLRPVSPRPQPLPRRTPHSPHCPRPPGFSELLRCCSRPPPAPRRRTARVRRHKIRQPQRPTAYW